MPSLQPSLKGWEWDCLSAARYWNPIAGAYGLREIGHMAVSCGSRYRQQRLGPPLKAPPSDLEPTVVVIDDDRDVREGLEGLMQTVGLRVELFAPPQEFLVRA